MGRHIVPGAGGVANLQAARRVVLAQQGREPAFRELIRRYERPVFSLIYRMVRDSTVAEDLAQAILNGQVPMGEKLPPQRNLAHRLGVTTGAKEWVETEPASSV